MSGTLSIPASKTEAQALKGSTNPTTQTVMSLLDSSTALAVEAGAGVAGAVDWVVSLPKLGGDAVGSLHIPLVSAVTPAVGAIFSGILGFLAHGQSFGTLKWLKTLRLWHGVESGLADTFQGAEGVAPLTVKSFLASVGDEKLRANLSEYFSMLTRVRDLKNSGEASTEALQLANAQLAKLEIKVGRRAELLELQSLATAADSARQVSHAKLESLAESMASKMIAAVEGAYKKRLGFMGSEMQGEWVVLAAKGESGREQLRLAIRDKLLSAYEAEQRGDKGTLTGVKTALHDAFLTKATMREATFYSVLGVLMNTGAIPAVVNAVREHAGAAYDGFVAAGKYLAPDWVKEAFIAAYGFANKVLYTVWGYLGVKAGIASADLYKHMTPHQHADAATVRTDAAAPRVDAGAMHTDTGTAHISQLDTARADAAATLGDGGARVVDHSSALSAAHGDASAGSSSGFHVDVARPHVDPRIDVSGAKVDTGAMHPKVHIK